MIKKKEDFKKSRANTPKYYSPESFVFVFFFLNFLLSFTSFASTEILKKNRICVKILKKNQDFKTEVRGKLLGLIQVLVFEPCTAE